MAQRKGPGAEPRAFQTSTKKGWALSLRCFYRQPRCSSRCSCFHCSCSGR